MSPKKRVKPNVSLSISAPELRRLEFVRQQATQPLSEEGSVPLSFALNFKRFTLFRLGVELAVQLEDFPLARIAVSYRIIIEMSVKDGSSVDVEKEWRHIGAQVAPAALYPFIRETIATTALKAGLPALVPPIVDFREMFDVDTLTIPLPQANSDDTATQKELL